MLLLLLISELLFLLLSNNSNNPKNQVLSNAIKKQLKTSNLKDNVSF